MKNKLAIFLCLCSAVSCNFSHSVSTDFITGLTTKGNGLSCDEVYLTDGNKKLTNTTFTFGEVFYLNFENMEGFEKEDGKAFPGMEFFILDNSGDTIMYNDDLYSDQNDGFDISPLFLNMNLIVASPMHSHNNYTMQVRIWDKKGKGTYKANMSFDVVPNEHIKVESNNFTYTEIYLWSGEREKTITDNNVNLNENIYMLFEGLKGFANESGQTYLGLSIIAKDAAGELILDEKDLIGESSMEFSDVSQQLAPNFIFTDATIKSPVNCEISIWDKKNGNRIKASVELNLP